MSARHILTVLRDPDTEYGPDAGIVCPGVTEACAEWTECLKPECKALAEEASTLDGFTAHGVQHCYLDGDASYWAVRTGFCYVENHGDADAAEFAEREHLGDGRYTVTVEVDDSTIILTNPEKVSA